eukprot:TRINITY_DN43828_c0_g1_i1.p1 TRINITY_DN43828_c0_g1~~TRINITY_DN43828_c0_g1_i1.p1  ORF type:complete len:483 (+),score=10.21 TRINITY_DN43828_c0_g1_i1:63-1511(+)
MSGGASSSPPSQTINQLRVLRKLRPPPTQWSWKELHRVMHELFNDLGEQHPAVSTPHAILDAVLRRTGWKNELAMLRPCISSFSRIKAERKAAACGQPLPALTHFTDRLPRKTRTAPTTEPWAFPIAPLQKMRRTRAEGDAKQDAEDDDENLFDMYNEPIQGNATAQESGLHHQHDELARESDECLLGGPEDFALAQVHGDDLPDEQRALPCVVAAPQENRDADDLSASPARPPKPEASPSPVRPRPPRGFSNPVEEEEWKADKWHKENAQTFRWVPQRDDGIEGNDGPACWTNKRLLARRYSTEYRLPNTAEAHWRTLSPERGHWPEPATPGRSAKPRGGMQQWIDPIKKANGTPRSRAKPHAKDPLCVVEDYGFWMRLNAEWGRQEEMERDERPAGRMVTAVSLRLAALSPTPGFPRKSSLALRSTPAPGSARTTAWTPTRTRPSSCTGRAVLRRARRCCRLWRYRTPPRRTQKNTRGWR